MDDAEKLSALGINPTTKLAALVLITPPEEGPAKPDASKRQAGGCKERERQQPSQTITVSPVEQDRGGRGDAVLSGAAGGGGAGRAHEYSEGQEGRRGGASFIGGGSEHLSHQTGCVPFQGAGHQLSGSSGRNGRGVEGQERGGGGRELGAGAAAGARDVSRQEQRRRALAAAERRLGLQ